MNTKSCDTPLGVPYNISQYALLLSLLAQVCDMEADELIWQGGDVHIYTNQLGPELVDLQLSREPKPLPKLWLNPEIKDLFAFTTDDIKILDYDSYPEIKYPVSV